jgi:hypothetical protein
MKQKSTLFLKIAVFLLGAPVAALGTAGLFLLVRHPINPRYAMMLYPLIGGIYASVIPYATALVQAFGLLNAIDHNNAFSGSSVKSLKCIKANAIVICLIYTTLLPFSFMLAQEDDAPGLVLMAMVPIFASAVIAVFAAVLHRLFEEAARLRSDQELVI